MLLDELHIALRHEQLDLEPVREAIAARPTMTHVITTGRRAPDALIELADLVTDFTKGKAPNKRRYPGTNRD